MLGVIRLMLSCYICVRWEKNFINLLAVSPEEFPSSGERTCFIPPCSCCRKWSLKNPVRVKSDWVFTTVRDQPWRKVLHEQLSEAEATELVERYRKITVWWRAIQRLCVGDPACCCRNRRSRHGLTQDLHTEDVEDWCELCHVDIARHLGIVLLKPGSELMPLFGAGRVLVEIPPASMKKIPSDDSWCPAAVAGWYEDQTFFMKKAVAHCSWWG